MKESLPSIGGLTVPVRGLEVREGVRYSEHKKRLSDCPSLFKTNQGSPILHEIKMKVLVMFFYKALQGLSYTQNGMLREGSNTKQGRNRVTI